MKQYDCSNADEVILANTSHSNKELVKNNKREQYLVLTKTVGKRLGYIRKKIGLAPVDVCKRIPMLNKSHFSEWESGKKLIPLYWICQLASLYGVSLDYLVGYTEESEESNVSFTIKRTIIESSQQYLHMIAEQMQDMALQHILLIDSQNIAIELAKQLRDAILRLAELNHETWPELRNGAKVELLIEQLSKSLKSVETLSRQVKAAKEVRAEQVREHDLFDFDDVSDSGPSKNKTSSTRARY